MGRGRFGWVIVLVLLSGCVTAPTEPLGSSDPRTTEPPPDTQQEPQGTTNGATPQPSPTLDVPVAVLRWVRFPVLSSTQVVIRYDIRYPDVSSPPTLISWLSHDFYGSGPSATVVKPGEGEIEYQLGNLRPGRVYPFEVWATREGRTERLWTQEFETPLAPIVGGLSQVNVTSDSAEIRWTVQYPNATTNLVEYSLTQGMGSDWADAGKTHRSAVLRGTGNQAAVIRDLFMDSTYYYRVRVQEPNGTEVVAPIQTFHTGNGTMSLSVVRTSGHCDGFAVTWHVNAPTGSWSEVRMRYGKHGVIIEEHIARTDIRHQALASIGEIGADGDIGFWLHGESPQGDVFDSPAQILPPRTRMGQVSQIAVQQEDASSAVVSWTIARSYNSTSWIEIRPLGAETFQEAGASASNDGNFTRPMQNLSAGTYEFIVRQRAADNGGSCGRSPSAPDGSFTIA